MTHRPTHFRRGISAYAHGPLPRLLCRAIADQHSKTVPLKARYAAKVTCKRCQEAVRNGVHQRGSQLRAVLEAYLEAIELYDAVERKHGKQPGHSVVRKDRRAVYKAFNTKRAVREIFTPARKR